MDYLYEDDEIICKINNFEMLSDNVQLSNICYKNSKNKNSS